MTKQKTRSVSKGIMGQQLDLHILQNKSWPQTFRMTLSCAIFPSWCSVCMLALVCLISPLEWLYLLLFINVLVFMFHFPLFLSSLCSSILGPHTSLLVNVQSFRAHQ